MENYYDPDNRWEMYGVANKEHFEQQYVVKGYFHDGVPKDVKDAFITVEYLMAHAYYYWFLYDEAFNKALRLLEMAIKQKAKLKSISLNNKSFDLLVKEICSESYNERLKNGLHRARRIRNKQVHADSNSCSGPIGVKDKNIRLFVNIINDLFRDDSWQKDHFEAFQSIGKQLLSFRNSLLIFENNAPGILASAILDFSTLNDTLFLVLCPIWNSLKPKLETQQDLRPVTIALSNFEFHEDNITGISMIGNNVKISKTNKPENKLKLENYNKELNSVNNTDRALYEININNEASWSIVELEYNYLSKNLI
jgi:hypothetical protein